MTEFHHVTVLERELVDSLALKEGHVAIDCTAGGGGHTAGLLERVGSSGLVIALDRDQQAIDVLHRRFAAEIATGRLRIVKSRFSSVLDVVKEQGLLGKVNGIAADIGVSSPQLDQADRGFSFSKDGPLDMRMDPSPGIPTAADVVNEWSEQELTKLFRELGEEPKARFIARAIVDERAREPITTTARLAAIVKGAVHYKEQSKKHPATKVFQALRIAVNQELEELGTLVIDGFSILAAGGRLGIISFHSLEDRFVKHKFQELTGRERQRDLPRNLPLTASELATMARLDGRIIKPFPIVPSEQELELNPRSRSAKLRVIEKI